jgi:ABC-type phosphate/phosphonate transport system permease subunit
MSTFAMVPLIFVAANALALALAFWLARRHNESHR